MLGFNEGVLGFDEGGGAAIVTLVKSARLVAKKEGEKRMLNVFAAQS